MRDAEGLPTDGQLREQARRDALADIERQRAKVTRLRGQLRREEAALDRKIAQAVSSSPTSPAWYRFEGVLPIGDWGKLGLPAPTGTTDALGRLMERYRKACGRG